MEKNKIYELLNNQISDDQIKIDEPMKNHTTFRIGGNADFLVIPKDEENIIKTYKLCRTNNIPLLIIGNGSNLIVREKGIRGVVMKIFNNFSEIKVENHKITAQSGALLSRVANAALENKLAGMEFASGIPGAIGGAVAMNAGAYGGEMKDVVTETTYLDINGDKKVATGEDHRFSYRKSIFQDNNYLILETTLTLKEGSYNDIKAVMSDLNQRRREKQPLAYPSAGSVFKRPEGYFTGKLIEDCGLKGFSIGGAQVSELHAGFIINYNNATSNDVIDLIKYVQDKVKEKFGVSLETEVKIIGEE